MVENKKKGTLFVVATPLGHLADITFRAVDILQRVDLIAAEDTRHSKKLLNHYDIDTRLISCHEHNEIQKTPGLLADLNNGLDIALISDAGTPTISDPGYKLVAAAAKQNIPVIPIPGCSAAIAGLSVCGLPTDSFYFAGFLPKNSGRQSAVLERLKENNATLIIYESPKRVKKLIKNMISILGNRKGCLAREITKIHEEYIRGDLSDILAALENKAIVKGECSLFVQGYENTKVISDADLDDIIKQKLEDSDLSTSGLAKEISKQVELPRKLIYDKILNLAR